jgi:hypothetical protein
VPVRALSDELRQAVTDLVGTSLTPIAWEQACLPIHHQGLGIRDPVRECAASRIAAMVGFVLHGTESVGAPATLASRLPPDAPQVLDALRATLGTHHDPISRWIADPSAILSAPKNYATQRWWADQCAEARRRRLPGMGTARDAVRLEAQTGPLAGEWLRAPPSATLHTDLSDREFRSLCLWWLGLPICGAGMAILRCPLPGCKEDLDAFGDHLVCCKYNKTTRRHNSLRDAWAAYLRMAGIPHQREVVATGRFRPADILLEGWNAGEDVAVDITVSHPLGAANFPLAPDAAARHLRAKEANKCRKHASSCRGVRWACHPAAYTPWGGQGPMAASLFHEVAKRAGADGLSWTRRARTAELRQALSLSLMREVARQLDARCSLTDQLDALASSLT